MVNIWALIHPEREALATDLTALSDEQWGSPSLCEDWTVREVVAHLAGSAMLTPASFLAGFARARFSFNDFSERTIQRYLGSSHQETLDNFRAGIPRTTAPPGPGAAWVGEAVIHAEDIRKPLGIGHTYDPTAVRLAADMYVGSNALIGSKRRIQGVRLAATDTDWASGSGPTASGSMLALLMAMTGRTVFLDELSGDGVEVLRGR